LRLRIALLKIVEESEVGESLHARCVVRHDVFRAWDVGSQVAVTVGPLMVAGNLAQVGGRPGSGDGAFSHTRHCWGVVAQVFHGGIGDVTTVGHDVELG